MKGAKKLVAGLPPEKQQERINAKIDSGMLREEVNAVVSDAKEFVIK